MKSYVNSGCTVLFGENNKEKRVYTQNRCTFFKDIFDSWSVESLDAEPKDMEGQPYFTYLHD